MELQAENERLRAALARAEAGATQQSAEMNGAAEHHHAEMERMHGDLIQPKKWRRSAN
jgi:hypothetical protein